MSEMLIDVTRLANRLLQERLPTGVDRVSLQYVAHYSGSALALVRVSERWVVLSRRDSQRVFQALLALDVNASRMIRRCLWRGVLPKLSVRGAKTVLINADHSGLDDPRYAQQVQRRRLRAIFFLHDLIPIAYPEYSRPGEEEKHSRRLHTMLAAGSGIVVNSSATLSDLKAFAQARDLKLPACAVAPLAPAALPIADPLAPLPHPYFVMLGTIEPRKNHLLLLHLWRQLVQDLGQGAPRLVLIGQRGWECEQVVDLLERCPALRGFVIEHSRCSDAELATWLRHARALLFPSFAEGFGIPLVEALAHGLPVIASELPAFREVAGEVPEYLDPLDGSGWRRAILDYLPTDSARRQAQCVRMQAFAAPSWDAHFAIVDALLERIDAGG
jgi:glycosyltransferase involved in cell wall biosynthesis